MPDHLVPAGGELQVESVYRTDAEGVLAEEFGDEIVAVNMTSGRYFSLRGLGRAIWLDLGAGHPPSRILGAFAGSNSGSPSEGDVEAYIAKLATEGLIEPRPPCVVDGDDLAVVASLQAGDELGELEMYDDMADLLLADPIHEVDEKTGWPAPRPESGGSEISGPENSDKA